MKTPLPLLWATMSCLTMPVSSAQAQLFAPAVDFPVTDNPSSVFAADLDGDSDNDLAVTTLTSRNVSVLLGNGDGTFLMDDNYVVGTSPFSVYAADLNGDTDLDLAVANSNSDNVSILFNLSATAQIPYPFPMGPVDHGAAIDGRRDSGGFEEEEEGPCQ